MFLENLGTSTKLQDAYAKYKPLYSVNESDSRENVIATCQSALDSIQLLTYALPTAIIPVKRVSMRVKRDNLVRLEYCEDSSVWWNVDIGNTINISEAIYNGVLHILSQIEYKLELMYNIQLLNSMMSMLASTYEIPYSITFFCGDGIRNLTNNSISIGISEDIVNKLESLLYRGGLMPVSLVFTSYAQTFKNLPSVIECMRRRTWFTQALGFYTRKNAKTIIRGSYHNDYRNISNGIGYAETPEYFALIRVNSVTAEELEELKQEYGSDLVYSNNTEPKSRDCFIANNDSELEKYKARLDKHNRSYRVEQLGEDDAHQYKIVFNQYNICAFVYGPVNLQTYAKPNCDINASLFDY